MVALFCEEGGNELKCGPDDAPDAHTERVRLCEIDSQDRLRLFPHSLRLGAQCRAIVEIRDAIDLNDLGEVPRPVGVVFLVCLCWRSPQQVSVAVSRIARQALAFYGSLG